ncbi:hypothetical protein JHK84_044838 [Glycine max]|nr:hypothetical protein JHK86_044730 [Glycine max]KAG4951476.1 hypothetical protein JHK85_045343 [Glycine max]KAG5107931.1 hypothetical protein JHK84_044838 [Glycine max]
MLVWICCPIVARDLFSLSSKLLPPLVSNHPSLSSELLPPLVISYEGHHGISGGERRRISIGTDIIHYPIMRFLDEPTSGLDSTSAFMVVKVTGIVIANEVTCSEEREKRRKNPWSDDVVLLWSGFSNPWSRLILLSQSLSGPRWQRDENEVLKSSLHDRIGIGVVLLQH